MVPLHEMRISSSHVRKSRKIIETIHHVSNPHFNFFLNHLLEFDVAAIDGAGRTGYDYKRGIRVVICPD